MGPVSVVKKVPGCLKVQKLTLYTRIIFSIFLFISTNVFSKDAAKKLSDKEIRTVGRCLFIKSEYIACYKKGLGKCQKKNKSSYQKFKCLDHLEGLAIEKWNEKYKEGLKACYQSMQDRFNYLWCEIAIEEKLTQKPKK